VFSIAVALAFAFLAAYPLLRIFAGLFFVDGAFTLAPFTEMFAMADLGELIFNTLVVVGASSILALILGAALAWLNERTDARMGAVSDSLPLIPFLIPPIAGAIGWVLLLSPTAGLLNGVIRSALSFFGYAESSGPLDIFSWYGLIFVYTLYQVPYAFMTVSAGLRNSDTTLEEQSRVSGAGLGKTLWKVTLPSVRPALGGAVLLMLVQGLALFSIPVIIGTGAGIEVLSVRIVELLNFTYPPQMTEAIGLSFIMILLVGIAWFWQNRLLRSGRHGTVGGKGQRFEVIRLKRWRPVARGVMIGYGLLAVVLPVGGLIIVTLNGYWTADIDWGNLSFRMLNEVVFDKPIAMRALGNSMTLGVVGATIGILAAAIISVLVIRSRGRFTKGLDGAIKLPSVVSHLVIGVGIILAFAGPPLNLGGTVLILLIAYVTIYLPQGSVSTDAAVAQVGNDLAEASAVSGAGYGRTFRRIYLPLIVPAMVAGWAYLFARMAGDLTATAILAGPGNITVGFLLLQTYQNGSYGQLAPIAVVLTVISSVVVITVITIANRWGRRRTKSPKVKTLEMEATADG
jgi:iron(III) transport system permease protein